MVKVDINEIMMYPSRASEDLGAIDLCDDEDIEACIEEVIVREIVLTYTFS